MIVNICGIPHKILERDDNFNLDLHLGQIDYGKGEIRINSNLDEAIKLETVCHEMVHGMLVHLGYMDQ